MFDDGFRHGDVLAESGALDSGSPSWFAARCWRKITARIIWRDPWIAERVATHEPSPQRLPARGLRGARSDPGTAVELQSLSRVLDAVLLPDEPYVFNPARGTAIAMHPTRLVGFMAIEPSLIPPYQQTPDAAVDGSDLSERPTWANPVRRRGPIALHAHAPAGWSDAATAMAMVTSCNQHARFPTPCCARRRAPSERYEVLGQVLRPNRRDADDPPSNSCCR